MENGESKEIQAVEKMDERSLKDFLEKGAPGKWALIPDFSYEKTLELILLLQNCNYIAQVRNVRVLGAFYQ